MSKDARFKVQGEQTEFWILIPSDALDRMSTEAFRKEGEAGRIITHPDPVELLRSDTGRNIIVTMEVDLNTDASKHSLQDHMRDVPMPTYIGWARFVRRNTLPRGIRTQLVTGVKALTNAYMVIDRSCPAPRTDLIGINFRTTKRGNDLEVVLNSIQPGMATDYGKDRTITLDWNIVGFPPDHPGAPIRV